MAAQLAGVVVLAALAAETSAPVSTDARRSLRAADAAALHHVGSPEVSPDGRTVAFAVGYRVFVVPFDGGRPAPVTPVEGRSFAHRWTPDGARISYLSRADGSVRVWTAKPDGREATPVTPPGLRIWDYAWSPDGARLAVTASVVPGESKTFTGSHVDLDLRETSLPAALRLLGEIAGLEVDIDPTIDGAVTLRLVGVPWDQALEVILASNHLTYSLEDAAVRITKADPSIYGAFPSDETTSGPYTGAPIDLDVQDEDLGGILRLFADITGLNVVVDPDVEGKVTMKVEDLPWDHVFTLILRSHRLGYALDGNVIRVGRPERLPRTDRPGPRVFTSVEFKQEGVGYLSSDSEPPRGLYVADSATGLSTALTPQVDDLGDTPPAWSADGRWIAFVAESRDASGAGISRLYRVAATANAPLEELARSADGWLRDLAISRDGRRLAWVESPREPYVANRLRLLDLESKAIGTVAPELDRDVFAPRFSSDGSILYFMVEDAGTRAVARVDLETGRRESVVEGDRVVSGFDLGPDGALALAIGEPHLPPELFALSAGRLRQATSVNGEVLGRLRLGPVERFRARSKDGTAVEAFVVRPPDAPRDTPLPTLLRLHGGPDVQADVAFDFEAQLLAAHGYAVVVPNPRGSRGYGSAFASAISGEWGSKDYEDVMAVVDAAVAGGIADPARLAVGGWSYGGYLTNVIVTRTTRFKAAVSGASMANVLGAYGVGDSNGRLESEMGLPWERGARWRAVSPFFEVAKVRTPVLVVCGEDDVRTPVSQSEQWYRALRRLGNEAELVIYPGEGHGFSYESSVDVWARQIAWYDRFSKRASTTEGETPSAERAERPVTGESTGTRVPAPAGSGPRR
jgi:dipeptidyl aminopeptidase/acylaminoacyl peptidase